MRARGVDHEINDLVADATVLQIDDLGCRQVVHHLGIADVAENDFVTEAGLGQRFHIAHTLGLNLATARRGRRRRWWNVV